MKSSIDYLKVFSWALYDFANTIYSYICVTAYLPPFLERITGTNFIMATGTYISMILSGISSPILGVIIDRRSCAKRWLIISTVICCFLTVVLGLLAMESVPKNRFVLLLTGACFALANYFYLNALVFYNVFLATISTPSTIGMISGFGTALGYVGPLLILGVAEIINRNWPSQVFTFAGLAFLVFSIPMFLFVPERTVPEEKELTFEVIRSSFKSLGECVREALATPPLFFCLLANFLAIDTLNTTIIFLTTYLENTILAYETLPGALLDSAALRVSAFDRLVIENYMAGVRSMQNSIILYMYGLTVTSIFFSFVTGYISDRLGSKTGFAISVISLMIAIICGVTLPYSTLAFYSVVVPGGAGLAGIWTAGRKMVIDITPPGKEGRYFGLYGLVGKVSAFGTMLFALITYAGPHAGIDSQTSYRLAFLVEIFPLLLSLFFLMKLKVPENYTAGSSDESSVLSPQRYTGALSEAEPGQTGGSGT